MLNCKISQLIAFIFICMSCNSSAQDSLLQSVSTSYPLTDSTILKILPGEIVNFLHNSQNISAYTFEMGTGKVQTEIDTTAQGHLGWKVRKHISAIVKRDADSLRQLLLAPDKYYDNDLIPKCGFKPDLGFRIQASDTTLDILVMAMSQCNLIEFSYVSDSLDSTIMVTREGKDARIDYLAIGGRLFPREYLPYLGEQMHQEPELATQDSLFRGSPRPNESEVQEEEESTDHFFIVSVDGVKLKSIANTRGLQKKNIMDMNPDLKWNEALKKDTKVRIKKAL